MKYNLGMLTDAHTSMFLEFGQVYKTGNQIH